MSKINTGINSGGGTYNKTFVLIICAVLVIGTIAAFEPMRHNGYVNYDDGKYIAENPQVKQGLTFETIKWAFTRPHFFMWHPLTSISYLVEYEFFGANPVASHLINLIFHIINVLLVFFILTKLTGAFWPSAFAAAVFAVHPLQVESVAWAAERKNVISGLFWLLAIAAYIRYAEKPKAGRYIILLLVYLLCILTKPTVVVVPFTLLLLDFWPLGRMRRGTIGKLVIEKIPLFLLAGFLCVITVVFQKSGDVIKSTQHFAFPYRLENAILSYVSYLFKFVCPVDLAVFYPHLGPKIALWQVLTAMVELAAITAIVFYRGGKRRYLITGWLWFIGTLVPVIGLVQVGGQAMADRYMYLPMIGLLIIIAALMSEAARKWRYVLFVISAAIFLVLIIASRNQVRYWHDDFTLFGHAIEATKDNENMHYNIGYAYQQKGQFDKAIKHYQEAIRIYPTDLQAMNNLGVVLLSQKKTDEALKIFEKAVQMNSRYVDSLNNLGLALREKGRSEEAIRKWRQALALEPGQPQAYYNIGVTMFRGGRYKEAVENFKKSLEKNKGWDIYNYLGASYTALGQFNAALDNYNEAIKFRPGDANIESNIALTLAKLGRTQQAIDIWQNILKKDPENIKAYYGLGRLFADNKQFDKAVECFKKLLEKKPDWYEVHFRIANIYYARKNLSLAVEYLRRSLNIKKDYIEALNLLAWIEAAAKEPDIRNPDDAVKLAISANELTKNENPGLLDTLAVAYASAGRFDDAVKTEEEALKLAGEHKLTKLAEEISKHLEMFKAKRAYYDD